MKTKCTMNVLSFALGAAFSLARISCRMYCPNQSSRSKASFAKQPRSPRQTSPSRSKPRRAHRMSCSSSPTMWDSAASATFGGPIPTPNFDRARERRTALQHVPHHGAVLAHACGADHRAQSPHGPHRRDHGDGHGLPGVRLADVQERRHGGRNPAGERLEHGLVRQEPQRPRLAVQSGRPVRPLADRAGIRVFLRLHRRGHRPVASRRLRGHPADRDAGA